MHLNDFIIGKPANAMGMAPQPLAQNITIQMREREGDAEKCDADRHIKCKAALRNRIDTEKTKTSAITRIV
jgi:hypothetical protein